MGLRDCLDLLAGWSAGPMRALAGHPGESGAGDAAARHGMERLGLRGGDAQMGHPMSSETTARRPAGRAPGRALIRIEAPWPRMIAELRGRLSNPRPDPDPVPEQVLTIASYNVHKCVGTDKRFDPARVAEVIGELGADIIALQEADRRFGARTGLLDLVALHRRTGLRLIPLSVEPRGPGGHGNALLVRDGRATRIERMALPGGEPRGAVVAELALPHGSLRVVAAHFGLLRRHRALQVGAILAHLARADDMPTIILGDMNEWRPGRRSSLQAFSGSFDPAHPGPATFPSRHPILPLDRILGRPRGLVRAPAAHDTPLARIASDHLPLVARLDLSVLAGAGAVAEAA